MYIYIYDICTHVIFIWELGALHISGLVGLVSAGISGGGVMSIMGSGTKAILMCWAEDPDRLHQEHGFEALHTELNNKAREWK